MSYEIERELTTEEREAVRIINLLAVTLTPIEEMSHYLPDNETILAAIETGIRLQHEAGVHNEHAVRFTRVAYSCMAAVREALRLFEEDVANIGDRAEDYLRHEVEKEEDGEEA